MGWFWGPSETKDEKKSGDALRDLDPSLRDFLAKESPSTYNSSNPRKQQPVQAAAASRGPSPAATPLVSNSDLETPELPSQSLYKDGRYAHLWKTYESQADVEAAGKSDQEKIGDVLEGYKYRRAEIGRAALENCAMEQWEVNECFSHGSWSSRMTMCRAENRKLERCYTMQQKFLKALGYLSTLDRSQEIDEKIQMHADTLYHRMLAQEKAVEDAKAAGTPVPSFAPLLSSKPSISTASTPSLEDNKVKASDLPPSLQKALKERLEGLNNEERELEEKAIKAEIQAGEQIATSLGTIWEKQAEERKARKEIGKETMGDKVASMFGTR